MPIKLVIRSRFDPQGTAAWERCFDQETVTIGRAITSDLTLPDSRRLVSSRHAEIRRTASECLLTDVGSTNGTMVNDLRLTPRKDYSLQQGDRICIGDFTIHFYPLSLSGDPQLEAQPLSKASAVPVDEMEREQDLVYCLGRMYAEAGKHEGSKRSDVLLQTLRHASRGLDSKQVHQLLEYVETNFPTSEWRSQLVASPPLKVAVPPSLPAKGAAEAAYEECVSIARKYCRDLDLPVSSELIRELMQRIDQVLWVTVNSLADAIKGRKQFAREFEVEVTRILAWTPNRIKSAEGGEEIGAYLFDPRRDDVDLKTVVADLEGAFRDLALHQVGLVAGFRECVRGLLSELDPESFEAEARDTPLQFGPLKIPLWFSILQRSAAWRRFKQKHQQLSEEEVKVFERILAPHFEKGYLSVQKSKGRC